MGIFSGLTWPIQAVAINVGVKSTLKFNIRQITSVHEDFNLQNPYLAVGKGHIRLCATGEDIPPFTVRINSFKETKQFGVKTYTWTVNNGFADVAELSLFIENKSVAVWSLKEFDETTPGLKIVTDKNESW